MDRMDFWSKLGSLRVYVDKGEIDDADAIELMFEIREALNQLLDGKTTEGGERHEK